MNMKANVLIHSLEIGQLVFSKAGRDKGHYYLIYALDDVNDRVFLVDGRKRNAENPKVKNPLHLQKTNTVNQDFKEKVLNKSVITSKEINEFFNSLELTGLKQGGV